MSKGLKRKLKLMVVDASTRSGSGALEEAINQEIEEFIEREGAYIVDVKVSHHGPHHDPPIIFLYLLYDAED